MRAMRRERVLTARSMIMTTPEPPLGTSHVSAVDAGLQMDPGLGQPAHQHSEREDVRSRSRTGTETTRKSLSARDATTRCRTYRGDAPSGPPGNSLPKKKMIPIFDVYPHILSVYTVPARLPRDESEPTQRRVTSDTTHVTSHRHVVTQLTGRGRETCGERRGRPVPGRVSCGHHPPSRGHPEPSRRDAEPRGPHDTDRHPSALKSNQRLTNHRAIQTEPSELYCRV